MPPPQRGFSPELIHPVLKQSLTMTPSQNEEEIIFALGCFWGAERVFWRLPGVVTTAVGYIAGHQDSPSYDAVCSGTTGHTEAVRVVWRPDEYSRRELLRVFWESHDPTQGNRQGNDRGSQYRSGIYTTNSEQEEAALASKKRYQEALINAGHGPITSEVKTADTFWYAEKYHQQYLHKNPHGYCGLGGLGVAFPSTPTSGAS